MKNKRLLFTALYLSFFFSGFSSLAFQILWVRLISLFFGHTAFAISAVLTVFMSGLALGSYIASRLKLPTKKLITLFIAVETAIGVFGLFSKPLIYACNDILTTSGILNLPMPVQFMSWLTDSFFILIILRLASLKYWKLTFNFALYLLNWS